LAILGEPVKKIRSEFPGATARIPLCKPYISEDEERAAVEVLRSGWLMQGSRVAEFEKRVADYVGVRHAVAVNSGTSALVLALMAVGLKAGDKVIMPSHSFIATANAAVHAGGTPVFVDIGRNDYAINPSRIGPAVDSQTRAVIVVHQLGFPADMDAIMSIAEENDLIVVEDAACSLGATYRGRKTGSFGAVACLSFHPRKVITTGEGGMMLTNSEEIAEGVRSLRSQADGYPGGDRDGAAQETRRDHRFADASRRPLPRGYCEASGPQASGVARRLRPQLPELCRRGRRRLA
jgi:dTDP-4-amino-4,6-dideoxygalactose transaminase